ncbi:hypothetical protein DKT77_04140 [Meridianimarinicoccus roseus]|uniref:Zinc finger/thioredoxin putative domain-containing protein n=1 Tax=Meridianimarinicoccus roseus TaxID=2072018 RepID=A0A2V2LNU1_9RHOB|nr:zinc-ribbon domain-containing protein [Meridianimarinicoccus roseus]PWR03909.1 hypothetical protein DKT77_04140 [Meridianimarinicoccus roseus]
MRIECPGCGARYDIPERAVPDPGRDVQCSSCGTAWFLLRAAHGPAALAPRPAATPAQDPPDGSATETAKAASPSPRPADTGPVARVTAPETDATDQDIQPEPGPDSPPRRKVDPSVLAILREEAEAEVKARKAARAAPIPASGAMPPPGADRGDGARGRLARLAEAERSAARPGTGSAPDNDEGLVEDPHAATRDPRPPLMAALPNAAAEQGATSEARHLPVRTPPAPPAVVAERRRRVGFRLGFAGTAGLSCAALALYLLVASMPETSTLPLAAQIQSQGDRFQAALVDLLRRAMPDDA